MFKKLSFLRFLKNPVGILSLLLVIALGVGGYFFIQYKNATKDPEEEARIKTEETVKKITNLMVVSDTSDAVMAIIADKSKLAGQKFFDVAENGDEVVLFPSVMKAVLYRPSIDKIIDVGPFIPDASEQKVESVTEKPAPKQASTTEAESAE